MTRATSGLAAAILLAAAAAAGAQSRTATANPHGSFVAACATCHSPDAWKPTKISAQFRHAPDRFRLEGAHASVTCTACHTRLDFTQVPTACASCHSDAHRGELGANCASCHSARSFLDMGRIRQAHQVTTFPLTGAHLAVDCRACHVPRAPGQLAFVSVPSRCESCHLANYKATTTPAHTAAGFGTDCESCHSPRAWSGAGFDHARTRFPLTGAHRPLPCSRCHADGIYRGKPAACVSCHQPDYASTTNPSHSALAFPTDCASCHTTTAWTPATFNHDAPYFPIYSGRHRGTWSSCATCHTNPADYKVFDCLSCHGKTNTDGHHREVSGYVYASSNCYACHRNGRTP
jgi:hypothetical protein